jgi:heterodisulfide reductase subunit A-like polyferredoxin
VATGATTYAPEEYMYGKDERVITQLDLEEAIDEGNFSAKRVVMIQCVGSREGDRMYCSRVCCSQAIKNALKIKEINPDTDVYVLYREVRSYGFYESYFTEARRKGVKFMRYDLDHKPAVKTDNDQLIVETSDPVLGREIGIPADMVVLAPAIVPRDDTEDVAKMLKLPLTKDNFFLEAHMKLRPVDFSVSGVFLAGLAHAPKNIDETILQAQAAASRAVTIISKPDYMPEAVVSSVDEDVCAACGICVSICNYSAPEIVTVRGKRFSRINKALCKSCGACASACPSGAVQQLGFKPRQIVDMIGASLE